MRFWYVADAPYFSCHFVRTDLLQERSITRDTTTIEDSRLAHPGFGRELPLLLGISPVLLSDVMNVYPPQSQLHRHILPVLKAVGQLNQRSEVYTLLQFMLVLLGDPTVHRLERWDSSHSASDAG